MNVTDAVLTRRSIRAFKETPVPLEVVRNILDKARWAPSGCNYQPWEAVVLTGAALAELQEKLLAAEPDDPQEYRFDAPSQEPRYHERLREVGRCMGAARGVERMDAAQRAEFTRQNMVSFGAPVLLLCHFPKLMGPPQWSDVGMWLQTIMLLVREAGLDSCPQEYMGLYGRTIKAHLGLGDDVMLFCGIAIGEAQAELPINNFERTRLPVDEHVKFLGF